MLRNSIQALKSKSIFAAVRGIAAVPATGKVPPTLEEFDPLNPGEWQLGIGGKILPRLPIGTRCGKLVMGKYGLYDPKLRKRVEAYSAGLDAGLKSEEATPQDARLAAIGKILGIITFILGIHNLAMLTYGDLLWPMNYIIKKKE